MKLFAIAAALSVFAAAPAAAQEAMAAPDTMNEVAAAAKFSLATPIEAIAADPAAKMVLEANFPGMTAHPAYDQFKAMSLTDLQPIAQGQITDEQLAKAKTELEAIK